MHLGWTWAFKAKQDVDAINEKSKLLCCYLTPPIIVLKWVVRHNLSYKYDVVVTGRGNSRALFAHYQQWQSKTNRKDKHTRIGQRAFYFSMIIFQLGLQLRFRCSCGGNDNVSYSLKTDIWCESTEGNRLRVAFRKYRPTVGTSWKFDFAHIWLIDNP